MRAFWAEGVAGTHKCMLYLGCDAQATISRAKGAEGGTWHHKASKRKFWGRRAAMDGGGYTREGVQDREVPLL